MKNQLFIPLIFCLFVCVNLQAQDGTVSGTLTSEIDGLPLPGVSIIVKGTIRGTQTDFDGNYTIKCSVGETLVFTYVGTTTKEVRVTSKMIGIDSKDAFVEKTPVQLLENDAYKKAIKNNPKVNVSIKSIEKSKYTYNKTQQYQYNRIKQIDIQKNKVNITYFKPDIYFEIGLNQSLSTQFFKKQNLPKLQSTYAQGASLNEELTFLGADTGTMFSYGPQLTELEFDGSNYQYDQNGRLVPLGSGNGNLPIVYDNAVLNASIKSSNHLFFNVSTDHTLISLDYTHATFKDIFNREKSNSNEIVLALKNYHGYYNNKLSWNAFLKYGNSVDNQPNINGFINNTLLNAWSTPNSFSNSQGSIIESNLPRRFNSNFNNPHWLLENNQNSEKNNFFIANVQNSYRLSDEIKLNSNLSYTKNEDTQTFGLVKNTSGFEEGYFSDKVIKKDVFNALARFEFDSYESNIEIFSVLDFSSEKLDYQFNEATGFNDFSFNNPESNFQRSHRLNRNALRINNKFSYKYYDAGLEMTVGNNSYLSSLQNNKLFLPLLQLKVDLNDLLNSHVFYGFYITATTAYNINDAPLFYNNQSHNSLGLLPSQSLNYSSNNDLFLSDSVALEDTINQELGLTLQWNLFRTNFDFEINYFNNEIKGSVFPVFDNNTFLLKNIADIRNRGIEFGLSSNFELANNFRYTPSIVFSTNRTKVLHINTNAPRIPIAGFSSISKNLIVEQPLGMIVGSVYQRDNQNNLVIDENGFPLVASQPEIIGDPTPDFNLGLSNSFSFADLTLDIVFDIQKGGDVWNGTQNTLNYLGTSQESAIQRNINGFVFQGVNQQGNPNTIPVDFYNPINDISQNRFVRYGYSGVDEEAIEDASYINLKSINLTYELKLDKKKPSFIREVKFSVFAHNLFTWTKYDGASPYRSLYDTSSGQNLNFFNMPITTEVGFKMNIKI